MTKHLTISELITKLASLNPSLPLYTSTGVHLIKDIDSYRGYYEDIAFSYIQPERSFLKPHMTVGAFLQICRTALGSSMTGYKGGDYYVFDDTYCWLANEGETSKLKVVDVRMIDEKIFLMTVKDEYKNE